MRWLLAKEVRWRLRRRTDISLSQPAKDAHPPDKDSLAEELGSFALLRFAQDDTRDLTHAPPVGQG
jgi:hypothetical protein